MSAGSFAFSPENLEKAKAYMARYPDGRQASAILPVLDIAQRQNGGWLSAPAVTSVADMLDMPLIRVYEVISFYEMFNSRPVGQHMVRVCTTTPCMLRGSTEILEVCKDELGIEVGETSADDKFTLAEFECLGACVNAPIVWIDDDYYEDLEPGRIREILQAFRDGKFPEPGSQIGRQKSAPIGGPQTLTEVSGALALAGPTSVAAPDPVPVAPALAESVDDERRSVAAEGCATVSKDDEPAPAVADGRRTGPPESDAIEMIVVEKGSAGPIRDRRRKGPHSDGEASGSVSDPGGEEEQA